MAIQLTYLSETPILKRQIKQPKQHFSTAIQKRSTFQVKASSGNGRQLIQSGTVRPIPPNEAAAAIASEGYTLLDIRPIWETDKARVRGALLVPLFVKDTDYSPVTLIKKWVHFGYIGLWTGQYLTTLSPDFVRQVAAAVPDKNTKLLVACGEGLRSIMAVWKLHEEGYKNLGWLAGGFNGSGEGDFTEVEGEEKIQNATIGGVSYYFLQLLLLLQAVGKTKSN